MYSDIKRMMSANDPKYSWWMTIAEGTKENACSPKETIEELKNNLKAKLKATGDHGWLRSQR